MHSDKCLQPADAPKNEQLDMRSRADSADICRIKYYVICTTGAFSVDLDTEN
jgi:hypothetical protein